MKQDPPPLSTSPEQPLRSGFLTTELMEQHARALAASHRMEERRAAADLPRRADDNAKVIARACADLAAALKTGRDITAASTLLLEHLPLIEEQLRLVQRDLSRKVCRRLPNLVRGETPGVPRIYQLAVEVVAHRDGEIDRECLIRFLAAYQEVHVLQLAELAALPALLRLALMENLRRIAQGLAHSDAARAAADVWAARMTETAERSPSDWILLVADMARSGQPVTRSFATGLARRLQGHEAPLAMQWLAAQLAEAGRTVEQAMLDEVALQAADQVSVDNAVASLRQLEWFDWNAIIETLSPVEHALRLDPDGTYPRMDDATRSMYRCKVEDIAHQAGIPEAQVVEAALGLARELREPSAGGLDPRLRHVGHYLVGDGVELLEQRLGMAPRARLRRWMRLRGQARLLVFLGGIVTFTALFTAAAIDRALDSAMDEVLAVMFTLVFAVGASQLAVALVHFIATQLTRPRLLPRLDFCDGIPDDAQALVVVPAMLYTAADVHALCDALEVRFLANRDPNLRFCLLTDFADADAQHVPGDAELLELVRERIDALNRHHASERVVAEQDEDGIAQTRTQPVHPFLLLHRARSWNARDGIWMGHERRRGKLAALNAFLRGRARDSFQMVAGDAGRLHDVRYVIAVDTDTQLPRGAARRLVATMAHPLNQAQVSLDGTQVAVGYGVLQPRMSVSLPDEPLSRYAELAGGGPETDPSGRSVSDVYQDLFAEGSFAGKGIYDVDAVECVLSNRMPENVVLSHDLLEGFYLRAGALSDQQLFEPYPSRYSADVSRRHRWVRGDWQIAGWLRRTVPVADGSRVRNPLSPLSRWKLFDRLRASLVAPAFVALLLMSWTVLPVDWFWTAAVLAAMFVPPLVSVLFNLIEKPRGVAWTQHASIVWHSAAMSIGHAGLSLLFLPYEAFMNIDAIVRTAWRMLVSRRRLLEWRPSSLSRSSTNLHSIARNMWFAPLLAVLCAVALQLSNPAALLLAGPFLLAWLLSPLVAWWVSLPVPDAAARLPPADAQFLHKLARRNWAFFEASVTEQENWLPPENMREQEPAHRTSPTEVGLALLSNLAAWDFGYITTGQLSARCARTLATVARLERFHGHLFTAYDTLTLEPVLPRYVSTAASGNFAGHLLTLAQGLERTLDAPLIDARAFHGISTTLDIVEELAAAAGTNLRDAVSAMRSELGRGGETAGAQTLPGFADRFSHLCRLAGTIASEAAGADPELERWIERLRAQCVSFLDELATLAPWSTRADQYVLDSGLTRVPTLRELATFTLPEQADYRTAGLSKLVGEGRANANERIAWLHSLAQDARAAARMDFRFLYNRDTRLLSTGYNVTERRTDEASIDLLASEARLASFVAIAKDQLPEAHWLAPGRQLRFARHEQVLASSGGPLCDYLLPLLVMPKFRGTLLDHSCRAAVRDLALGRRRGLPWGLAASRQGKRNEGIGEQYLALMVEPELALRSLRRLSGLGYMGPYGFQETVSHALAHDHDGQQVPAFVTRHHGIGLLALDHLLSGQPMQRRFNGVPELRATLPLLQERVPIASGWHAVRAEGPGPLMPGLQPLRPRMVSQAVTPVPHVHLMSNGRYRLMVSSAGAGYSQWRDLAVTRWRRDGTRDHWGSFCYVRDASSGAVWSTTYQPTLTRPGRYEVMFAEGRAMFRRHDAGIDLDTWIAVSPEDDVEVRRTRVVNNDSAARELELTSYVEVADLFNNAEILAGKQAIVFGQEAQAAPCLFHLLHVQGAASAGISFETRRPVFIGRGHDTAMPRSMRSSGPLAGSSGMVDSPIAAIRCRLVLGPGESASLDYITGMAEGRASALGLVGKYRHGNVADRAFALADAQGLALLRQLDTAEATAQMFASLAGSVIYPGEALRAEPSALMLNQRGQSGLRAYGITGELPVVLVALRGQAGIALARQMMQAHAYWRIKGLQVDLVIWCHDHGGALREQLAAMAASSVSGQGGNRPGGIFVRSACQVPPDDQLLMLAAAHVVIDEAAGPLASQVARMLRETRMDGPLPPMPDPAARAQPEPPLAMPELQAAGDTGGFTVDGREYVVRTAAGQWTPAPWTNVLANPSFGTVVTESGQASTWIADSHGAVLTPSLDDPVIDTSGEAFYIRDEQSGRFWSPSALPATGNGEYITRHGFGYSVYEHAQDGISSEMTTFVAPDAPLKYSVIRIRNDSTRLRRLSVTGYVEWVLGERRDRDAVHIVTELDTASGALFARNPFNEGLAGRVGFFHINAQIRTVTCDRVEFIGRNRSLASPAAMQRRRLSGRTGPAPDPCAAFCAPFALRPGEERELVFVLGVGGRRSADAAHMIETCGGSDASRRALDRVRSHWNDMLEVIEVRSPDPALDMMINGWLPYQAVANCMDAHAGDGHGERTPPSSGQLLDALAALPAKPQLLRGQLLRFAAGDADDCLWLPYATARYVAATGDDDVLAEYDSTAAATLYQRCVRAVRQLLESDRPERGRKTACPPWFLAQVLALFGSLAESEGDRECADRCRDRADRLAAEATGEDGEAERDSVRSPYWVALGVARTGDAVRAWELQRRLNPAHSITEQAPALPGGAAPYAFAPGTAGMMHLLAVEALLGLRLREGSLTLAPLLPAHWPGFTMRYRHGTARYLIDVQRADQASMKLDGRPVEGATIPLEDDGAEHRVELRLAPALPIVS